MLHSPPNSRVKSRKKEIQAQLRRQKEEGKELEQNFNKDLISAVHSRKFIYDRNDPRHSQKKLLNQTWEEISTEVGREASFCQVRWRNLKDTFNKKYNEWKSNPVESERPYWTWFDSLLFLKEDSPNEEEDQSEVPEEIKPGTSIEVPDARSELSDQEMQELKQEKGDEKQSEKIFNENLIAAVYARRLIYDKNDAQHDRKHLMNKSWEEISGEVGREVSFCRTRWRSLKDTFIRKYNEWKFAPDEDEKPSWPWFDSLLFLRQLEGDHLERAVRREKDPAKSAKRGKLRGKLRRQRVLEMMRGKELQKQEERIFNEDLIAAVYARRFLYDKEDPEHDRKTLVNKAWGEISDEVGREASFCRTRWKSLKDTFVRKYNEWKCQLEEGDKPTWPWFDSLLFLKEDHFRTETTRRAENVKKVRKEEDGLFRSSCLFCCKSISVSQDRLGGNFRENSKIVGYFCKAWRISGDLYAGQMELSPFCRDCVGIVESVGALMESIDALEMKLNSKKNLILELLKKEYRRDEDVEEKLYSAFAFSPSNFRQDLVEQFRMTLPSKSSFFEMEGTEPTNAEDVSQDLDFTSPVPTVIDSDHEFDGDSSPPNTFENPEGILAEEKMERGKKNYCRQDLECKIPPGTTLKDCFVKLSRLKSSQEVTRKSNQRINLKKKNELIETLSRKSKTRNMERNDFSRTGFWHRNRQSKFSRRKSRIFKCPHCNRILSSSASLSRHIRYLHIGEKNFVCEICGDSFRSDYLLTKHGIKSHGKDYPVHCDVCGAGFFRPIDLTYHNYTHTGEWPCKCADCGAGFPNESSLDVHRRHNHFGQDVEASSLLCKFCGKKYPSEFLLDQHEKRHAAEKSHKCSICLSAFKYAWSLRIHMRNVHTEKRDFICQLCGADFKTKSNLGAHIAGHSTRKMPFFKRNRQKHQVPGSSANNAVPCAPIHAKALI